MNQPFENASVERIYEIRRMARRRKEFKTADLLRSWLEEEGYNVRGRDEAVKEELGILKSRVTGQGCLTEPNRN